MKREKPKLAVMRETLRDLTRKAVAAVGGWRGCGVTNNTCAAGTIGNHTGADSQPMTTEGLTKN